MRRRDFVNNYARALLDPADSQEQLNKHLESIESVAALLEGNPKLVQLLSAAHIPVQQREEIFKKVFQTLDDDKVYRILLLLLERKKIGYLPLIAKEYRQLVMEQLSFIEATVVTVQPLKAPLQEKLRKKLETAFKKKVEITQKLDPSLIGGMQVIFQKKMLDLSIKGRVQQLEQYLKRVT
jgi:ATP synthase F1 delta subunit